MDSPAGAISKALPTVNPRSCAAAQMWDHRAIGYMRERERENRRGSLRGDAWGRYFARGSGRIVYEPVWRDNR